MSYNSIRMTANSITCGNSVTESTSSDGDWRRRDPGVEGRKSEEEVIGINERFL